MRVRDSEKLSAATTKLFQLNQKLKTKAVVLQLSEDGLSLTGTGDPVLLAAIKAMEAEIVSKLDFTVVDRSRTLPLPEKPIGQMKKDEVSQYFRSLMKFLYGNHVGYGDPMKKPSWWGDNIPWTKTVNKKNLNYKDLYKAIRRCFNAYGQEIDMPEQPPARGNSRGVARPTQTTNEDSDGHSDTPGSDMGETVQQDPG